METERRLDENAFGAGHERLKDYRMCPDCASRVRPLFDRARLVPFRADAARSCRFGGKTLLAINIGDAMMHYQLMPLDRRVTDFSDTEGFGLGGSVLLDPARRGREGAAGHFGWSGAASMYYLIDPHEDLVAILLLQHLPPDGPHELPKLCSRFHDLVREAIEP